MTLEAEVKGDLQFHETNSVSTTFLLLRHKTLVMFVFVQIHAKHGAERAPGCPHDLQLRAGGVRHGHGHHRAPLHQRVPHDHPPLPLGEPLHLPRHHHRAWHHQLPCRHSWVPHGRPVTGDCTPVRHILWQKI